MRRLIGFDCEGTELAATLDEGMRNTGLLIVSGGNEVRCGAHRGMAILAQRLSADGTPVFRYDRRGVGDSDGPHRTTIDAKADLLAAVAAFRRLAPHVERIVAYGNCDAAAALALHRADAGIDGLVLANPWLGEESDTLPPVAAIRARYRERLHDPAQWRRLLSGGIDIAKALRGLSKIVRPATVAPRSVMLLDAVARIGAPTTIVLATGDATAIAFAARRRDEPAIRTVRIPTDSHSFARAPDMRALEDTIRAALA